MLRALLLLSLVWNALVPPARACRTEPGESRPVCVPPSARESQTPATCCAAASCCDPSPDASPRTCSELLCFLCPCRVPTTPQEPAPPGAKTVLKRFDTAPAAPLLFFIVPVRYATIESLAAESRYDAALSHNSRRSLLSVWLK